MTNLENINALSIKRNVPQQERLKELRNIAIQQLRALVGSKGARELNSIHSQLKMPIEE